MSKKNQTKKLPNNTAVLRSEVKTQADFNAIVEVARYQGFDMSKQRNCKLRIYISNYIHVDKTCKSLMQTDHLKTMNIITLAEFLSYGEPNLWHERGELPPVGEVVDVFTGEGRCVFGNFTVTHLGKYLVCGANPSGDESAFYSHSYTFKPLPPEKTERELVVEEMLKNSELGTTLEQYSKNLYDKGYHNGKKVKPVPDDWKFDYADSSYQCVMSWLIVNGYCIAEGE